MSIPTVNISHLNVDHLHLSQIEVDDVLLHHIDTKGYALLLYRLFLCLFSFIIWQTIAISYITIRLVRKPPEVKKTILTPLMLDVPIDNE